MRQELLDQPDRSAQVDVDLPDHVNKVAVLVEAEVAHDPALLISVSSTGNRAKTS